MKLSIKRCSVSKRLCAYPSCNEKCGLKLLSKEIRYTVLFRSKVFIPYRTLGCPNHSNEAAWLNIANIIVQNEFEYSKKQIQEMFDLLLSKSTALKSSGISREFWNSKKNVVPILFVCTCS